MPKTAELIPTRASLLTRLKHWDDQEGWKRFFDTYWRLIYSVARRAGLNEADAQDVVQETVITVAKKMPKFKYDPAIGSFKGWLSQLTRCRVIDHIRKRQHRSQGQILPRESTWSTAVSEAQPDARSLDLERAWDEEWSRHIIETALDLVKGQVARVSSSSSFST